MPSVTCCSAEMQAPICQDFRDPEWHWQSATRAAVGTRMRARPRLPLAPAPPSHATCRGAAAALPPAGSPGRLAPTAPDSMPGVCKPVMANLEAGTPPAGPSRAKGSRAIATNSEAPTDLWWRYKRIWSQRGDAMAGRSGIGAGGIGAGAGGSRGQQKRLRRDNRRQRRLQRRQEPTCMHQQRRMAAQASAAKRRLRSMPARPCLALGGLRPNTAVACWQHHADLCL